MTEHTQHISVLPKETMDLLALPPGGIAVDGTLGMAGHAVLMAECLGPKGHLIGIDRDSASLALAKKRLTPLSLRVDLLQGSFKEVDRFLNQLHVKAVDGILLDLGISSVQLDDPQRGFAFKNDGPLDMRMDQNQGKSAADLVNTLSEAELAKIIDEYGEERFAKRIARAICYKRSSERIATTGQLAMIILKALPMGYQRGRIHPATRTFQALRIVVNEELDILSQALRDCFKVLKPKGRLAVIAFHSLEDRIVKNTFRHMAEDGIATLINKKPVMPTEEEADQNPRARSARLRVIEKI